MIEDDDTPAPADEPSGPEDGDPAGAGEVSGDGVDGDDTVVLGSEGTPSILSGPVAVTHRASAGN